MNYVNVPIIQHVLERKRRVKLNVAGVQRFVVDKVYPVTFDEGDYVLVEAPDFFKGRKLAWYLEECPDHDDGHLVYLINKNEQITTKKVCVRLESKGNSMIKLSEILEHD